MIALAFAFSFQSTFAQSMGEHPYSLTWSEVAQNGLNKHQLAIINQIMPRAVWESHANNSFYGGSTSEEPALVDGKSGKDVLTGVLERASKGEGDDLKIVKMLLQISAPQLYLSEFLRPAKSWHTLVTDASEKGGQIHDASYAFLLATLKSMDLDTQAMEEVLISEALASPYSVNLILPITALVAEILSRAESFGEHQEFVSEYLLLMLTYPDPRVRAHAAFGLSEAGRSSKIEAYVEFLLRQNKLKPDVFFSEKEQELNKDILSYLEADSSLQTYLPTWKLTIESANQGWLDRKMEFKLDDLGDLNLERFANAGSGISVHKLLLTKTPLQRTFTVTTESGIELQAQEKLKAVVPHRRIKHEIAEGPSGGILKTMELLSEGQIVKTYEAGVLRGALTRELVPENSWLVMGMDKSSMQKAFDALAKSSHGILVHAGHSKANANFFKFNVLGLEPPAYYYDVLQNFANRLRSKFEELTAGLPENARLISLGDIDQALAEQTNVVQLNTEPEEIKPQEEIEVKALFSFSLEQLFALRALIAYGDVRAVQEQVLEALPKAFGESADMNVKPINSYGAEIWSESSISLRKDPAVEATLSRESQIEYVQFIIDTMFLAWDEPSARRELMKWQSQITDSELITVIQSHLAGMKAGSCGSVLPLR